MKPTIEEVKEYFKNAKEIKCLGDGKIYDISDWKIYEYQEFDKTCINIFKEHKTENANYFVWCYSESRGYAKIISYKEETLPIKKTTLLQLAENNSFSEEIIKKEFPQLFQNLYVGIWYKNPHRKSLMYFTKIIDNTCFGYGFDNVGIWSDELEFFTNNWEPATEQEVFEALKNEAVKRGFKEGVKVISVDENTEREIDNYDANNIDFEIDYPNSLNYGNITIFKDGVWASLIDQPKEITISERLERIEKHLGL